MMSKGLSARAVRLSGPRLPRCRRVPACVVSYRRDQKQQDRASVQTEAPVQQQVETITPGDLTRASAEELRRCETRKREGGARVGAPYMVAGRRRRQPLPCPQPPPACWPCCRCVLQLQADNAELQAEIQHLAGSLRAALETGTAAAAALGWHQAEQEEQEQDDGPGHHQQQSLGHPHHHEAAAVLHTHTLGHDGSIGSGSWHASVDGGGSMLASLDALPGSAAVPPYHQPTSVSHATLSCSMQHPGSICCSKLSSALDPGGAACTISLHTTARWVAAGGAAGC